MKKIIVLILSLFVVSVSFATTSVSWIWQENFESYLNGQLFPDTYWWWDNNQYAIITNSFNGHEFGSQVLFIQNKPSQSVVFHSDGKYNDPSIPSSKPYTNGLHTISFDIFNLGVDNNFTFVGFGDGEGWVSILSLMIDPSRDFEGEENLPGCSIPISYIIDLDKHYYSIFVNEKLFISEELLGDDTILSAFIFCGGTGASTGTYVAAIDNFYWSVTTADTIPEPATVTLLLLGGGFLVAKRRK